MKHLCYILLLIVVSSNCLKVNLKSPLMPNYNENLASYAESFFSSKHNVFKNNHNGYNNYPSISEEKIDQNSRRINLNFDDIERLETEKIDENPSNLSEKNGSNESQKQLNPSLDKSIKMRRFLIK